MNATPWDQATYQVRFEWGIDGLRRLAGADIVVVVDVLRFSTTVVDAVAAGSAYALDDAAHSVSINGARVAAAAALGPGAIAGGVAGGAAPDATPLVLLGSLRNAAAVAVAVRAEQQRRGGRTSISVIAAGELAGREAHAPLRLAVEDQLGAGAVIDALGSLGIDHTSPEAAVAAEGFRALRGAVKHMLAASGSGRELAARGRGEEVAHAAAVDACSAVPVLRQGVFVAHH